MITREILLKSKEYWLLKIQNELFNKLNEYMEENNLNRTQLAIKLGVTKGYISQVLNGDFDHRISKLVELSLAINKAPMLEFEDLNQYINDDKNNVRYVKMPKVAADSCVVVYSKGSSVRINKEQTKEYSYNQAIVDMPVYNTPFS